MSRGWKNYFVTHWSTYAFLVVLAIVLVTLARVISVIRMQVSPYQSIESINRDYKECAKGAPQGFDCVMVPMLVTTDYIQELPK